MSQLCGIIAIIVANLVSARKSSTNTPLVPVGFDPRLVGTEAGGVVVIFFYVASIATAVLMVASVLLGILLWYAIRSEHTESSARNVFERKLSERYYNGEWMRKLEQKGKVITITTELPPNERQPTSEEEDESLGLGVERASDPTVGLDTWSGPPSPETKRGLHFEKPTAPELYGEDYATKDNDNSTSSSSDEEFEDLDDLVKKHVRRATQRIKEFEEPMMQALSSYADADDTSVKSPVDPPWRCDWCLQVNSCENRQCSICCRTPSSGVARALTDSADST